MTRRVPDAPGPLTAMSEEERLLREILALQREMAEELRAMRADLKGAGLIEAQRAARAASEAGGVAVEPLIEALASRNRTVQRAATSLSTPNRRKP